MILFHLDYTHRIDQLLTFISTKTHCFNL